MRRIANLQVSDIVMGCATIGQAYAGQPAGGSEVVEHALASGINLFDTAPSYGESELLLAKALAGKPAYVSTKFRPETSTSIGASKRRLMRVDLLAVHNFTQEDLKTNLRAFKEGVTLLGATVYEPEDAEAAIKSGIFDFLQAPYNVLDQRFESVFSLAERRHCSLILRSPLLRGMLSPKAMTSTSHFEIVDRLRQHLDASWSELPALALRFCLLTPYPVLLGMASISEVNQALEAQQDDLSPRHIRVMRDFATNERNIIDPRCFDS